ncbi:MAG TPA: hypothetical protein VMS11_04750 [Solirubrobacterales bacterium]|nr:hypothetical protein [Solirubrobacterales bacterium]
MRSRTIFGVQVGLIAEHISVALVSASLGLGGASTPSSLIYAADRRAVLGRSVGIDNRVPLEPSPIPDARAVRPIAQQKFTVTWRWVDDEEAVGALRAAGMYWTRGGPVHQYSSAHRHHLRVEARTEADAKRRVEQVLAPTGAPAGKLEFHYPDPERLQRMTEAAEAAEREIRARRS